MIVGEAHVVVRAITSSVAPEIRRAFSNPDIDRIGSETGRRISRGINDGVSSGGGGGGFFNSLASQAEAARAKFDALITASYTLGPAISGLVGAISALVGAFGALASTVAGALPSLAVLPGLLANLAIVGGTLKLAFSGVGQAISAGMKAASASMKGAGGRAKDLTSEIRRLEDAQRRLKEVQEDSAKSLAKVSEERNRTLIRLSEAQADADARLANAEQEYADTVIDASADVAEAKARVRDAQLDLNDAYEKAREEIEQLNFAAEDAALNQQKAALDLEKARETLLRVQDLPPNSRARKEAELAFAQADLNYRKAVDTNKDMAKEQDRLAKEGVDGTKTVRDAKKDLAEATQRQAQVEVDAAKRVAKAEEDLAKERVRRAREQRDLDWELQDLDKKFADAVAKADKDIADAKRNLKRAQEDYNKALKSGGAAGVAAMNSYKNAMDKLGPSQRAFVEYMVKTFIPSLDELKKKAGEDFFPKLIPALELIRTRLFPEIIPLLQETGGKLGSVGAAILKAFVDPTNIENIKSVWGSLNTSILPNLQSIGSNAVSVITGFLAAAQPLVERFVGWVDGLALKWKNALSTTEGQQNLQTLLNKAGTIAGEIGGIVGNIFKGLGNIVKSQMEPDSGGYVMLRFFRDAAKAFADFTGSPEGIKRIEDFFKNTADNAKPILGFIGDLVKEFLKLGENPNIGSFFDKLREFDIAKTVTDIANAFIDAGPEIAEFTKNFLEFAKATLESEGVKTFFSTFSLILSNLTKFFENPTVKSMAPTIASIAAAGVALRTSWSLAKIPVLGLINPITQTVSGIKNIASTTKDAVGGIQNFVTGFKNARAAQSAFATPMMQLGGKVKDLASNLSLANIKMGLVSAATKVWTGIQAAFNLVMAMNPIALIVIAIAALVAGLILAYNKVDWFREAVDKAFQWIKDAIAVVVDWFQTTVWPIIKKVIDFIIGYYKFLWGIIQWVWDKIYAAIEIVVNWFRDTVWPLIQTVIGWIVDYYKTLWAGIQLVWDGIKAAIDAVVSWFRDTLWPIIQKVIDWIINYYKTLWDGIKLAWEGIKKAISAVGDWFKNTFLPIITGVWDKISGGWETAKGKISAAWDALKSKVDTIVSKVKEIVSGIWDAITSKLEAVRDRIFGPDGIFPSIQRKVSDFVGTISGKVRGMWDGMIDGIKSAWNMVARWWNDNIAPKKITIWTPFGDKTFGFPTLPSFALGGVVYPQPGGVVARVAEAGKPERIEPLDENGLSERDKAMINMLSGGAGGTTINIYSQPGMDEVQLAKIVSREISFMMRRGSV